ncbi:peptidoglycan recognition protein family protein [Sporosarcina beigongshangi]|uniref:peptidoglycan recognition protein family protein n=1 Tax=Sporosarcina beigongshangi TaxID=2782538 RepID=UPI001939B7CC|nr:N-acetylmuramoyl-L-alanine amidase [Sporosarcina beigongshangi]
MAYTDINHFIPTSLYPLKAPYVMTPETITIHNTANDATAINEIAYMTRNKNATSFHVAIDDKHAVHGIPFNRNGWHAGDGNGDGNRKSIGIEICFSKSGSAAYKAAEANAIEYIARLLKQFGWDVNRVKWHRDWSGKQCPHRIIAEGRMTTVHNAIAKRLAELNTITSIGEKEGVRMFSPSSATLKMAFEQHLAEAVKDGLLTEKWLTDFKAGKLSLDDALALTVIIDQRGKKS